MFPDGAPLDRKAYPWLLNGLVRAHFQKLKLEDRPLTRVENLVSILLAWWVVPFTLLAFWLRFLPRHDWWVTTLHVALIAGAAWFGVYSYRLAVRTLSGGATSTEEEKRGDQPLPVRIWRTVRRHLPSGMATAGAGVTVVLLLSVEAEIAPGRNLLTVLGSALGYKTYADLTDDDVSTKPSGWTGRKETADVEVAQVKGADLEGRDLRNADASRAFLAKAKLAGADLSNGADLRGADLRGADLRGADLTFADLNGADLRDADLRDADLTFADLTFADLSGADLSGADLSYADLSDANLLGADLSGADLSGADLSYAELSYADLSYADLSGADLSYADLREAHYLTQAQLDRACGDDTTHLPRGLTIGTCPDTAPPASPSPPTGSS